MNSIRKRDLTMLIFGLIVYAAIQGMISEKIIGSFWQLNIILICVNVIMAVKLKFNQRLHGAIFARTRGLYGGGRVRWRCCND